MVNKAVSQAMLIDGAEEVEQQDSSSALPRTRSVPSSISPSLSIGEWERWVMASWDL